MNQYTAMALHQPALYKKRPEAPFCEYVVRKRLRTRDECAGQSDASGATWASQSGSRPCRSRPRARACPTPQGTADRAATHGWAGEAQDGSRMQAWAEEFPGGASHPPTQGQESRVQRAQGCGHD